MEDKSHEFLRLPFQLLVLLPGLVQIRRQSDDADGMKNLGNEPLCNTVENSIGNFLADGTSAHQVVADILFDRM
mgnify:CR=1 FL=1